MDNKKYIKTLADEEALKKGCYIDEDIEEEVINFCHNYLKTEDDKNFHFLKWFREDVICPLFCWRQKNGKRRFYNVHIFVPRGNGKTYQESALALALQILEDHAGETTALIAPTTKQAEISFNCMGMFLGNECPWAESIEYKKQIRLGKNQNIQVLAAENARTARLHGYTGPVILDELHGINRSTFDAAKTTAYKSKHPLLLTISTAGTSRRGTAWDIWGDCEALQSGRSRDIHTLSVVYKVDEADDWGDFEVVKKANPGVVELNKEDVLKAAHSEAIEKQHSRASFLQLNCNRWSTQAGRWLNVTKWDRCYKEIGLAE